MFVFIFKSRKKWRVFTHQLDVSVWVPADREKTHKRFLVFNIKWFRMFVPSLSWQMSSFRIVSFRFVSFRFVSFRFVSF
eukprot:COSAG06_NODE_679_length_13142_cov_15.143832_14_plen_79_part_00